MGRRALQQPRVPGPGRPACGGAAGAAALAAALVAQLGPPATATATLLGGAGGFLSGLLVIALAPAIEWLFGYTTRINLLEMISYEHPLLKRLIAEAPGTFQHSATVGVLADAGAAAIGADRLLVRVGALYHDIGKIENGALFIENQRGPNPHDSLPPAESARIVRRHVTDGVTLVERYGLGDQVAAFVRSTTALARSYFPSGQAAGLPVDEAEHIYPGLRPASRETAVLMADQVEAVGCLEAGAGCRRYRATIARRSSSCAPMASRRSPSRRPTCDGCATRWPKSWRGCTTASSRTWPGRGLPLGDGGAGQLPHRPPADPGVPGSPPPLQSVGLPPSGPPFLFPVHAMKMKERSPRCRSAPRCRLHRRSEGRGGLGPTTTSQGRRSRRFTEVISG